LLIKWRSHAGSRIQPVNRAFPLTLTNGTGTDRSAAHALDQALVPGLVSEPRRNWGWLGTTYSGWLRITGSLGRWFAATASARDVSGSPNFVSTGIHWTFDSLSRSDRHLRRTQRAARARRRSQSFRNWPPNSRRIAPASENRKQGRSFPTGLAMRSIPTACCAGSFCRRLRSARSVASQNRSTAEQPINTNGTRYCPRGAAGMLSAAASRPTLIAWA
jgi:hypothetical protein